jgi:hypothetical protein
VTDKRPFIIIGCGRGGTSLLAACLSGHSALKVVSEHHSIDVLLGWKFPVTDPRRLLQERLVQFYACCETERAWYPDKIWVNKITTEQISGLEEHNLVNLLDFAETRVDIYRAFVEQMAGYRFVFIIRDGRSCIASKMRRTDQNMVTAAFSWRYAVHVLRRLRAMGALSATIRFEDLVLAPRDSLTALCSALSIEFEVDMLRQTQSEFLMPEYRQDGFLVEKTEIASLPEPFVEFIRDDLNYCGYLR